MSARRSLRRAGGAGAALALVAVTAAAAQEQPASPGSSAIATVGQAPGEAIVRFEPGTSATERRHVRSAAGVAHEDSLNLARAEVVEIDGSVAAALRRLERQPHVAYAQPNYRYAVAAVEPPDDPLFGQLWGLSDPALADPGISALEAWEDPAGAGTARGAGQVIAVLDTGVDLTHPDLAPNLWSNPGELGIGGLDEDGNGFVDDVHGYDFVDDDGDPDDYEFHGTHVAGTAAAVADDSEGIAGVAPEAEIMAVRVLDGDGVGFTSDVAEGIAYAAEEGAGVINLSLGGDADPGEDRLTEEAIELAAAQDAVIVAAVGNEAANNDVDPHTPCALPQPNLICVAALNRAGALASFSNFGPRSVDVAAPGGGDVAGGGILSARTDYGAPLFEDDFESGFGAWQTATSPGGIPWSPTSAGPDDFPTDSIVGSYAPDAISALFTASPLDLGVERGCRVHFAAKYEVEPFFDAFEAGAFSEGPTALEVRRLDGTSSGSPSGFVAEEASIADLSGEGDVRLLFRIVADEEVERDGAYVDDVELVCRDETYGASNYVRFSGTSMATPHVAGVVALVRAAVPGLSALEAIEAVLEGASAIPVADPSRRTATEGIADACQAIGVASGIPAPLAACPGSSENVPASAQLPSSPSSSVAAVGRPGGGQPGPGVPRAGADRRRPRTFFRRRPPALVRTSGRRARVVFRFGADEPRARFLCRIDRGPLRRCGARLVRRVGQGRHVLRVVARDAAGNTDPTPAVHRFRVERLDLR
jgi:thermitase